MASTTDPFPRPPLDTAALDAALVRPGGMWHRIEVLPEAGSTNTELAGRARRGAPHGSVLVTEHQTSGRGRLGRGFSTPPRAALTFSLLVRPGVPTARLGWLSALMGVAAVDAVRRVPGVKAALKWPNDVIIPAELRADPGPADGKLAGILSEIDFSSGTADVVVGIGINVSQDRAELPVDTAVSLRGEGFADLDRDALLAAVLGGFEELYTVWTAAGGDAEASGLAAVYQDMCATIGRRVRVHLPGERFLEGTATGVDSEARLLVEGPEGKRALSVGDVVHVRPGS
ncbi:MULTISPECIES: biotin--[acetyl-CoA-carboxylase] ligase [Nocardiopsis]|uniref:biotin--[biotin carboxyl-carrier protein] ligase n=1 Tax=Nocardiopsis sinuspersici TaxID=501010 RepID=A0A1V3C4K2_9ACTN|nr:MULTISPECIES: biotin--[acetyl-CoA-carboxylase] ligase [Nocardiopsis]OOC55466.1 biotin--[acetyl-CoA-carboxylase] ligase [Nocardiopsis sinuspersici]